METCYFLHTILHKYGSKTAKQKKPNRIEFVDYNILSICMYIVYCIQYIFLKSGNSNFFKHLKKTEKENRTKYFKTIQQKYKKNKKTCQTNINIVSVKRFYLF